VVSGTDLLNGDLVVMLTGHCAGQRFFITYAKDGFLGLRPVTKRHKIDRRYDGWSGGYPNDQFEILHRPTPSP
jgi:hypothetical protein